MEITTSYAVEVIKPGKKFRETIKIYRAMEAFFVDVANKEWDLFSGQPQYRQLLKMEEITHATKGHPTPKYGFDRLFPHVPSYLRRAALTQGIGRVSSYRSNYANWETSGKKGNPPSLPKTSRCMPCFYNANTYKETDDPTKLQVKLYDGKTWDWVTVSVLKTDVRYIQAHCANREKSAPTLAKKHGKYFLRFAFTEKVPLNKVTVENQTVCAVDLGINTNATCSIMRADGTILAREFIDFPSDKDCLYKVLGRVKRLSRESSSANSGALWRFAKALNNQMSYKIAAAIVGVAHKHGCDVIVFEYLDTHKKKRGKNKEKLAWWAHQAIQKVAALKAHQSSMRVYHVNAKYTSKMAYDGSGEVRRGKDAELDSYSLCKFSTGKEYNCDLNASYNIGARYFIRELLKPLPVTVKSDIEAKVPECQRRTSCTLNTLIELHKVLSSLDIPEMALAV